MFDYGLCTSQKRAHAASFRAARVHGPAGPPQAKRARTVHEPADGTVRGAPLDADDLDDADDGVTSRRLHAPVPAPAPRHQGEETTGTWAHEQRTKLRLGALDGPGYSRRSIPGDRIRIVPSFAGLIGPASRPGLYGEASGTGMFSDVTVYAESDHLIALERKTLRANRNALARAIRATWPGLAKKSFGTDDTGLCVKYVLEKLQECKRAAFVVGRLVAYGCELQAGGEGEGEGAGESFPRRATPTCLGGGLQLLGVCTLDERSGAEPGFLPARCATDAEADAHYGPHAVADPSPLRRDPAGEALYACVTSICSGYGLGGELLDEVERLCMAAADGKFRGVALWGLGEVCTYYLERRGFLIREPSTGKTWPHARVREAGMLALFQGDGADGYFLVKPLLR